MGNRARWVEWLPWISLGAFSALWLARWPAFPLVLDPYYHLLIAQQVAAANGPMAHEWWQYAPMGRPHMYPPVLHLLLAGLLEVGASPIVAIRAVTAVLLPGLLLSVFLVLRRLFNPSIALWGLVAAMVPYSFHLHSAVTLAATLAMIELLWCMAAVREGRWLAAGTLLGLLCYTHLGMPWIALLSVVIYGCLRRDVWRHVAGVGWGMLLGLPWWWHLVSHRAVFQQVSQYENQYVEVVPVLFLAAIIGGIVCGRSKQHSLLLIACWVGFSVMAWRYPYRWLSGEGLLPIALLAGVGLHWLSQRLAGMGPRRIHYVMANLVIIAVLCGCPTVAKRESGWRLAWADSSPFHLLGSSWVRQKELDASLVVRQTEDLSRAVALNSQPREILWSNAPYVLGLVAALAQRPMSSAMFNEVGPAEAFDPVAAAQLLVWFRYDPLPGEVPWSRLAALPLTKVFEDEMAVVYRRRERMPIGRDPTAVVPLWMAMGMAAAAIAVAARDLRARPRSERLEGTEGQAGASSV